jgi:DNA-binding NtrC family response regulator
MELVSRQSGIALIVEDDVLQRQLIATLFEASELHVVECETAEAALEEFDRRGDDVVVLFTDVQLAGPMDGIELAFRARHRHPDIHCVIASGQTPHRSLPEGVIFMAKPVLPLDVLREAERSKS